MDKIRNLSVRKTILLYLTVSLISSFILSGFIVGITVRIQEQIWWNYVDEDTYSKLMEGERFGYTMVPRPDGEQMTKFDYTVSEICDFLQTYTVLFLSVTGSCIAVFLFYRHKLKYPITELECASQNISQNNLNFHITYENKDEMGYLCQEFERMREQLVENNRKLWRSLEDEKALRAAIAHDIRSPLSVLKGYHEMLMEYLLDETMNMEMVMEMLEESGKQLERMEIFIEAMQKMSSLEKREMRSGEVTAEQLQEDIVAELKMLEKKTGKHIVLNVRTAGETFFGDKEVILEVMENLLSNALRYAKKKVEITLNVAYGELRLCVKDDGEGFGKSIEEATKAFCQQNVKDSLKHTGMGMYISRLYCEKHGGKLLLENCKQSGASVTAVFCRIV